MNTNIQTKVVDYANWLDLLDQACASETHYYVSLNSSKNDKKYVLSSKKDSQRLSIDQIIKQSREYTATQVYRTDFVVLRHFYQKILERQPSNSFWTKVVHWFKGMGFLGTKDLIEQEIKSTTWKINNLFTSYQYHTSICMKQPRNRSASADDIEPCATCHYEKNSVRSESLRFTDNIYKKIMKVKQNVNFQFDKIAFDDSKLYEGLKPLFKINNNFSRALLIIDYIGNIKINYQNNVPSSGLEQAYKKYNSYINIIVNELKNLQNSNPSIIIPDCLEKSIEDLSQ